MSRNKLQNSTKKDATRTKQNNFTITTRRELSWALFFFLYERLVYFLFSYYVECFFFTCLRFVGFKKLEFNIV
ncbi:unnamed protein product [Brassica oleracea]